jgi:ATP-dependent helicase/nuclease subunit A
MIDNHIALDPRHSVVVESCAGSGKTWLLVSRIVRLLLAGVRPGEILAITFTRKAAQEMQERLHEWLHHLAVADDAAVREFLRERGLDDPDDAQLARARELYGELMLTQPAITISTFHGWFMQILQRAPLNAGVPVGMSLLERTSALREEAWQAFADSLRAAPESDTAQRLHGLFEDFGLHSTRALLESFVDKRAEWWAYTSGQEDPVAYTLDRLRAELGIELDADPVAEACADAAFQSAVQAFAQALATGTEAQCDRANELRLAWETAATDERFAVLTRALYTQAGEPRSFKPTRKQDAAAFMQARDVMFAWMERVKSALAERGALRMNHAALHCGAALLEHYQELKRRQQQMDFTDVEWQVCRLLNQSEAAEYMQYKLDSRYRQVLLDEFQDTNPLQWRILQAWFAASAAVDSRPAVFVVGDPKQSIYRFRRADARLFGEVCEFLQAQFEAQYLRNNVTRRNAPAVLQAVNGVFGALPPGSMDFAAHAAHHDDLPGHVEAIPLLQLPPGLTGGQEPTELRNPLITPRAEADSGARELEAETFAAQVAEIVATWSVRQKNGALRRAAYGDIMVLVRKRTHLRVYEHALGARHIPFITSRRGGLLDTLEARDIQALLTFLITPFADLELAQALRSPLFSCSDADLIQIAQCTEGTWWQRVRQIVQQSAASAELVRAQALLQGWLQLADQLPVHDLLDRIYFESDATRRYNAAVPAELRAAVAANLRAFMEIALNVDAGRYPSLPRFLDTLRDLRTADDSEAPSEGRMGEVGNALRIYTVHEAKGLEAPIVWLLDANDMRGRPEGYGVLLDWPPAAVQPLHFSLYGDRRSRGEKRARYFDAEDAYVKSEEMNLLYVAMTRAKQALIVSGHGELDEASWYGRIAAAYEPCDNLLIGPSLPPKLEATAVRADIEEALCRPFPAGGRKPRETRQQQHGTWLHALLQHLTEISPLPSTGEGLGERESLRRRLAIPAEAMETLWPRAQHLIALPHLQRFFDSRQYRSACNEMPYVNAAGELKRIDRLVEFDDEVWVLDYKLGDSEGAARYRGQMREYRAAMQAVYAGKKVRCTLVFADGEMREEGA